MKLVSYWKQCWKLTSFQLAMVVLVLEWTNNLFVSMPTDFEGWAKSLVILTLPIARLVQQTSITMIGNEDQ